MCVFSFPCTLAYTKDSFITCIKMYTRCPICKTNFSVSEAQLQVAQGKVRCGSCKNVFNARQHIHYHSTSSAPRKSTPDTTTPPVSTKKPDVHFTHPTESLLSKKTKPNENISQENISQQNTSRIKHAKLFEPPPKSKSTPPSSIDAIFNALDSQLTSGTYIDIAKSTDTDIREADFDDDDFNQDNHLVSQQFEADTSEPDLNLEDLAAPENNAAIHTSTDDSQTSIKTQPIKQKSIEKKSPQHTFDFASMANKPDLSLKDEQQNENAALHQAIDNIIKVDNHITTPFDEHDDDHFVIETETQPDVELVDEDDIDKLFASTDSLKISDLKFDKHLTNHQTEEPISILNQSSVKLEMESTEKEGLTENKTSFNLQVEEQLKPESFESESSDSLNIDPIDINPENPTPENLDSHDVYDKIDFDSDFSADNAALEMDTDNFDIEEEIVLTSPEANPETHVDTSPNKSEINVPHRLRDAVASFDQKTPPPSVAKRFFYSFASLLLTLLLTAQLVLFKSTALANSFPALQPVLTSLCDKLPCRYTGNHDSRQIKIISRDVRLHPKIKGALLISATIINQANYAQPYPTILLKFTDLTGNTVAQRYFSPKDYLGLLNKPFALMPSKKPVQLNIEILDPGSDAINFQFFFL